MTITIEKPTPKTKKKGDPIYKHRIFVSNLQFNVTHKDIQDHFEQYGKIINVLLPREYQQNKGYSFVSYETEDEVKAAVIASQNGFQFHGRKVFVITSDDKKTSLKRKGDHAAAPLAKKPRVAPAEVFLYEAVVTKIPATVTKQEIGAHFSTYGEVLDVTYPLKSFGKRMRGKGFAYVAFKENQELEICLAKTHKIGGETVSIEKGKENWRRVLAQCDHGLYVYGLPGKFKSKRRLKEHFSTFGEVTNLSILDSKEKKGERYAIVSYGSEEEQQRALADSRPTISGASVKLRAVVKDSKKENAPQKKQKRNKKTANNAQVIGTKVNSQTKTKKSSKNKANKTKDNAKETTSTGDSSEIKKDKTVIKAEDSPMEAASVVNSSETKTKKSSKNKANKTKDNAKETTSTGDSSEIKKDKTVIKAEDSPMEAASVVNSSQTKTKKSSKKNKAKKVKTDTMEIEYESV